MSWVVTAVVGASVLTSVGTQAYQGHQMRKEARKIDKQNKAAKKEAEQIQKAGEMTAFNTAQRAGRVSASRGNNIGASGTILGGGVNLSNANNGTQAVGAKTLLGQ